MLPSPGLQQPRVMNQTGAVMGPQRAGTHQATISPGQSLFQDQAVTGPSQLRWASTRESKSAIQADGQHQTNRRLQGQRVQEAITASRAAGCISSWEP